MSFDMLDAGFEQAEARADEVEVCREEQAEGSAPAAKEMGHDPRIELIRQLARELALAHGEDPDEQPYPVRHPRWRFYCARAKVLLSISEAEHRALAAVLREGPEPTRSLEPSVSWARFWPARRSKVST